VYLLPGKDKINAKPSFGLSCHNLFGLSNKSKLFAHHKINSHEKEEGS